MSVDVTRNTFNNLALVAFDLADRCQYVTTRGTNVIRHLAGKYFQSEKKNHWLERKFLPTLPLPPLSQSIKNIIEVAERVLPKEEFRQFTVDCKKLPAQAYDLQASLWFATKTRECWNEELWQIGAYNSNRAPLRESSHWLGFDRKPDGVEDYSSFANPECVRGGIMLRELFKYKEKLIKGESEVDLVSRFKGLRIDAATCPKMFSVRHPGKRIDTYTENVRNSHVIVEAYGHHYELSLVDDSGNLRGAESLASELIAIKVDAKSKEKVEHPVSVLTTDKRDTWFKNREMLLKSEINQSSFATVESALMIIHLDEEGAWSNRAESALRAYNQRTGAWDDLTLNVRVQENTAQLVSICGHGNQDATAGAPTVETIYKNEEAAKQCFNPELVQDDECQIKPLAFEVQNESLGFDLTGEIQALIDAGINPDLKAEELVYTAFTKEKCKKAKLNPDSVVQQAFQLAWVMSFGPENGHHGVESYEAISKRAFRKGRTEQAHPFSRDSELFVISMTSGDDFSIEGQAVYLKGACKALSKQKREVLLDQGKGHDRHLFSLYVLSKYFERDIPALETYVNKIFRYKLSTSYLPQAFGAGGAFLPTEKDGIGIFYPIADADEMRFLVTSHLDRKIVEPFMDNLKASLDQINALLDHIIESQKKELL